MNCPLCNWELIEEELGVEDAYYDGDDLFVVHNVVGACPSCEKRFKYREKYKMVLVEEELLGKYARRKKHDISDS